MLPATKAYSLVLSAILAFGFAGCAPRPTDLGTQYGLGPAREVVLKTTDHYGGFERLKSIHAIQAKAVVTSYDYSGAGLVSAEEMTIEPNLGRISSAGHLPCGTWSAVVLLDGPAVFKTTGAPPLSCEQQERITSYLKVILHSVRGPMNLLGGGEHVVSASREFIAGVPALRVESAGRPHLATAYFFDTAKYELAMITANGVAPPERGTVAIYSNKRQSDGVVLPVRIEVRDIGENALVGEKKVLDVQLQYLWTK